MGPNASSRTESPIHAYPHDWLWRFAIALFLCDAIWIAASGRISVTPRFFVVCILSALIGVALTALRKISGDTFDSVLHRGWCLGMLVAVGGLLTQNATIVNHLLMTLPFPLADDRLLGWDRALGVDWLAYAKGVASKPTLAAALSFAYAQFSSYGLPVILGVAVALDKQLRVLEVVFLLIGTAAVCLVCSAAFPARAAFATLADQELLALVIHGGGDYHLQELLAMRGTDSVLLRSGELQGLSTFPSFHTVLAMLIMWCSRGHFLTSLVAIPAGLGILGATPIYGGHYFVDIFAGVLVVVVFIGIWERWLVHSARLHVANALPRDPCRIGPKRRKQVKTAQTG